MDHNQISEELQKRIKNSVSPFHTALIAKNELIQEGFCELTLGEDWTIEKGRGYVITPYDSTVVAFTIGAEWKKGEIRIASAHTDFPCFKIKPDCEIYEGGYVKLNVEVYGGPILNTWMDRPLSIAGKVALRSENTLKPKTMLVDFVQPVMLIPNLAIHLNKEVNKGVNLNRQKDMLPIIGFWDDRRQFPKEYFIQALAKNLGLSDPKDILDYELYAYQTEGACLVGLDAENAIFSGPRLDNLTSVQACVKSMIEGGRSSGINMIALFDNEEIGSKTKQGAGSTLMRTIWERMYHSLERNNDQLNRDMMNGFMLSVDVAHALHPNIPEKNDPTNKVLLNGGTVLKIAANQSYANDCEAVGAVMQLCDKFNIPYQKFVNRSDETSGSTLGSISSTGLPMRTMDIGIPLLGMHSARETMGINDQYYLEKLLTEYFRV